MVGLLSVAVQRAPLNQAANLTKNTSLISLLVDDVAIDATALTLTDDGRVHRVEWAVQRDGDR